KHGGEAIASYKGNPASFATMHATYGALFLRALGGSKNISAVQIDTGAKNIAQELTFGSGTDWTFPDIEESDFLIMIGANPLVSHMSIIAEPRAREKLDAIHAKGGVVVIDPRRTETARRYEHVPVLPDSDAWLVAAMISHVFAQGLEAREVLEQRTNGWEELRDAVKPITPELAESRCGIRAATIRSLAERLVTAESGACYSRVGTNRGRFGTLTNLLIESLNVIAGKFGIPGGWITGLSPMGQPGPPMHARYGSARSRIGDLPLVLGSMPGGSLAAEITTPGEGQVRALIVDSGNPVHAYPDGDTLAEALEELELHVGMDFYVNETTRHAHYILPTPTFLEREDLTDYWVRSAPRPWMQFSPAVIEPQGESRHEFDIYNDLLSRMGLPALFADPDARANEAPQLMDVADKMFRIGPFGDQFGEKPEGLTIEKLRRDHPSGVRTMDRFDASESWSRVWTEDGKAQLWHDVTQGEIARLLAEPAQDADRPLLMFGRRKLGSLNSWMHNVERLVRNEVPTLLMHPDDAKARSLDDGQNVRVSTDTGSLDLLLEVTDDVVPGSVCYPHGFGHTGGWKRANAVPGANINRIVSSRPEDWEQVSGNVHVDGFPVRVEAA
ncbi:MAG: molybdopterin-dependent oxidoreductase, partial [Novosphingobium sp.]|nr:molybdopterin-dependent oxidoreductase [Novosphingobium sp.]